MGRSSGFEEIQGYGAWLRVTSYNPGKSSYTIVSGMGDGLGGLDGNNTMKQSVKPRKEPPVDTQSAGQTQPITESHPSTDFHDLSNKDITENRDVPQLISREISPQNPQVVNDFPIIYPSPHPRDFESQIEEIDTALKKFESHNFSTPNMTDGISIFAASSGDNLGVIMNRVESGEH